MGLIFLQIDSYKEEKSNPTTFSRNNLIKKIILFIQEGYRIYENQGTIIILLGVLKGILDESVDHLEEMQVFFYLLLSIVKNNHCFFRICLMI